jgi:anaerobic ribonucleoside-triphosphate reductase
VLLPQDIVDAHNEGIIHFHDADYFAQHMHNCDLVNLEDMLQNGTVISGTLIEKPHSFSTACNIATQIIAQIASNQYGGQSISLTHLAPFVDISRQKIRRSVLEEIKSFGVQPSEEAITNVVETRLRDEIRRVQTIQYQVVTLMTTNGQAPFITVFMYLGEARNEQERKDLAIIIEETLRQRIEGVKNEKGVWITPAFPKLIYVLEEDNIHEDSKYFYLTRLAAEAGGPLHSQADGSGLYLGEKDARAEALQRRNAGPRRRVHLHGLPQLPDARPLRHRLEQCRKRRQL